MRFFIRSSSPTNVARCGGTTVGCVLVTVDDVLALTLAVEKMLRDMGRDGDGMEGVPGAAGAAGAAWATESMRRCTSRGRKRRSIVGKVSGGWSKWS